jgi:N-acetylglucosaminyl-diphospho-decaprenol L-rhamnosyltransferase
LPMVADLLSDLQRYCQNASLYITVILNIPEQHSFKSTDYSFPVDLISNLHPRGFSTNHNAAFRHGQLGRSCGFFCVVNPDVRLNQNIFPLLLSVYRDAPKIGLVAPLVLNPAGGVEDSARPFPRPYTPILRAFGMRRAPLAMHSSERFQPDWIAGMFMLFQASTFELIGGFDERYFLYYEDLDICARLRLAGLRVLVEPATAVIHIARRDSHRKLKYLLWHIRSAVRFFSSPVYRRMMNLSSTD